MYKQILIATDGSELADRAVAHGLKLANEAKARVTIVTVTEALGGVRHDARCGCRQPDLSV